MFVKGFVQCFMLILMIVSITISSSASAASMAIDSFNAYPQKYLSEVISIEAPNIVHLSVDSWLGVTKALRVTLPGIDIPENDAKVPLCQVALAKQATEFTRNFLNKTEQVYLSNINMENIIEDNVVTDINTLEGSLKAALLSNGFAHLSGVKYDKPWCE